MTLFFWSGDVARVSAFGVALLTSLLLPVMIWYACKYYSYRNNVMLKKRYSSLTITQAILSCIAVFGMSIFEVSIVDMFGTISSDISIFITAFFAIVSIIARVIIGNIMLFRNWQITFDNNLALMTQKHNDWQALINPNASDQLSLQNNWWVQHKQDLGNYFFVRKVIAAKFSIESLFIISAWLYVLSFFFFLLLLF